MSCLQSFSCRSKPFRADAYLLSVYLYIFEYDWFDPRTAFICVLWLIIQFVSPPSVPVSPNGPCCFPAALRWDLRHHPALGSGGGRLSCVQVRTKHPSVPSLDVNVSSTSAVSKDKTGQHDSVDFLCGASTSCPVSWLHPPDMWQEPLGAKVTFMSSLGLIFSSVKKMFFFFLAERLRLSYGSWWGDSAYWLTATLLVYAEIAELATN